MAGLFGSDPELAGQSSSQLAAIRDQIDPVGQWLGDPDALGVPQVSAAVGEFGDTASSVTEDLSTRVGGASDLLGALASGTQEVDASLASRLGLTPASGPEPQGAAGVSPTDDGVVFAVAQDVHDGDVVDGFGLGVMSPAGLGAGRGWWTW